MTINTPRATKDRETASPVSEERQLVRNILYTRFPTEVHADILRAAADEIVAALASPTPPDTLEDDEVAVERVAIALCIAHNNSAGRFKAYDFARAAIAALNATQQPTRETDQEAKP